MIAYWETHAEAAELCPDGMVVCAAPTDEQLSAWRYFHMPADANPDDMRAAAHEVRYGVPMEPIQRWIIEEAKRYKESSSRAHA